MACLHLCYLHDAFLLSALLWAMHGESKEQRGLGSMQGRAVKCMKVVSWALVWAQHLRIVLLRELWGAKSRQQLLTCCVFRTCTIYLVYTPLIHHLLAS